MSGLEVPPWRCIGFAGWAKGHMFKTWGGSINTTDFCIRCGMPKGGWKP